MTDTTTDLIARLDDVADALECFGEDKHPADIRKEAARDIREAIGTIERLSQQVAELKRENFALAAGQCIHDDGLSSDDGGTPYCKKQQRIAALESELAALANQEPCGWQFRVRTIDTGEWTQWEHSSEMVRKLHTGKTDTEFRPVFAHQPAAAASEALTRPEWADCETRGAMVRNSLKHRLVELKVASKRVRGSYAKDFMRIPCEWLADAYDEAVKPLERRLAAIAAQKESKT